MYSKWGDDFKPKIFGFKRHSPYKNNKNLPLLFIPKVFKKAQASCKLRARTNTAPTHQSQLPTTKSFPKHTLFSSPNLLKFYMISKAQLKSYLHSECLHHNYMLNVKRPQGLMWYGRQLQVLPLHSPYKAPRAPASVSQFVKGRPSTEKTLDAQSTGCSTTTQWSYWEVQQYIWKLMN